MQPYQKTYTHIYKDIKKQLQYLIHTTLKHSSGALNLCQPHELFPQIPLLPFLRTLQTKGLISVSHLNCCSHLGLNLSDDLVQQGCLLSHLFAQAPSKTVHQPDAAGSLRCLLLNLPAANDTVVKACRLLIELKLQLHKLGPERRILPPDFSQRFCEILRHRVTLLMHHQLTVHHKSLSFQPGLLRPLHIAHPEVCSCKCHVCGARLKDWLSRAPAVAMDSDYMVNLMMMMTRIPMNLHVFGN